MTQKAPAPVSTRPWRYERGTLYGQKGHVVLEIGDGYDGMFGGTLPSESDARLIVRAVNAHDELVKALRDSLDFFENLRDHVGFTEEEREHLIDLRDLLARLSAKEGTGA